MATDFFARQGKARRNTAFLVAYLLLSLVGTVLAVNLVLFLAAFLADAWAEPRVGVSLRWWFVERWQSTAWISGVTGAIIVVGTVWFLRDLRKGGAAVAARTGARLVGGGRLAAAEARLVNVVEEMAIAAAVPCPQIYVLETEKGINAFAAGLRPSDAVLVVTRGALDALTRDELQGVVAHEFSHIVNGDMNLNLRLAAVLGGLLAVSYAGFKLTDWLGQLVSGFGVILVWIFGGLIVGVGFAGRFFADLLKAAISREREFLADAAAIQFTRNPTGLGHALVKAFRADRGTYLDRAYAESVSHMCFLPSLKGLLKGGLATHPPLVERLEAIDPLLARELQGALEQERSPAASKTPVEGAAAFAPPGAGSRFRVDPAGAVSSVGRPLPEHLAYAERLYAALPEDVRSALRKPEGAAALVRFILAGGLAAGEEGVRLKGLGLGPECLGELRRLGASAALPLVDLAIPSLRRLSAAAAEEFLRGVDEAVDADGTLTTLELALRAVLRRHLRAPPRLSATLARGAEVSVVLSALARAAADESAAASAYAAAVAPLRGIPGPLCGPEVCGPRQVQEALSRLASRSPRVKRQLLGACARAVTHDGAVTLSERELLRAVADSLDCPMPPLLPSAP